MPASSAQSTLTGFSVDEASHAIRFERHLACKPQKAFEAWTSPDEISQWWDPAGEPLKVCEIDLKVGGEFTFVGREHPERPFVGSYREIDPPNRPVFEAMGAIGLIRFEGTTNGTRMSVEITCQSEAHLAQFVSMGVATHTSKTLDNLVQHAADSAFAS
jgi:uncharacterized protein YndB with AHSA1/START domain